MFKKSAGKSRKFTMAIGALIALFVSLLGSVTSASAAPPAPAAVSVSQVAAVGQAAPSILALQTTHCGITAAWDYDGSEAYTGYKVQIWSKLTTARGDDGTVTYYRRFCVRASKTVSSTKTLTVNLGTSASTTGTAIERSVLVKYGASYKIWTRLGSSTATKHYLILLGA